ncbi:gamma-butyrobetaine,2-oxoglutarate dioxygenase [Novosphingobium nitrogenifigens DSM 19370]|uniref:Gamma-butyrobetaine,2-oxoglutarate dioxygenase n=1 Tax=Novosphingobium nitrogenifigens DSM 19370 TaxID=983920 RepID=F1ZCH4_9SPHN|nr:TauD/TfdA family dioxygenase [Novosphingobium nitrogenifigens]EGD57744.1 gamma-butyrobetaine,2-oxoglutarate dioxygenase [Novosphingobium nitrogenifigens DSM 19370]
MDLTITEKGQLKVAAPGSEAVVLHPIWLRERLPDAAVLDARTGQRLEESAETPTDLRVTAAELDGTISFSDGFATLLPSDWLTRAIVAEPASGNRVHWDGTLDPALFPAADLAAMKDDPAVLGRFLDGVETHGFGVVRGVPLDLDGGLEFAGLIGPIRRTNWGGVADVKAIPNAYDLTMTPRHLEPHSDNPYREPVPGYILLHCLTNDADGGDSTLVDGFHAAAILRRDDPEAFEALVTTDVTFRYHDETAFLENHGPLIECNAGGDVVQIRYSNRTEMIDRLPVEKLERYYEARAAFWKLIAPTSPLTLQFRLQPGELLMMDNYRLLHGRTGYTLAVGSRHMRQCYLDRDFVGSRRRLLAPA